MWVTICQNARSQCTAPVLGHILKLTASQDGLGSEGLDKHVIQFKVAVATLVFVHFLVAREVRFCMF